MMLSPEIEDSAKSLIIEQVLKWVFTFKTQYYMKDQPSVAKAFELRAIMVNILTQCQPLIPAFKIEATPTLKQNTKKLMNLCLRTLTKIVEEMDRTLL